VFYIEDCLTIKLGEQLMGVFSLAPNPRNKVRGQHLYFNKVSPFVFVPQRDLDFTVTFNFDGELMQLHESQHYNMR